MQKLFSEFKPNTAAEWKAQLLKDLKGETYESLVWHNENGFEIKPFYTEEDLKTTYEPAFVHTHWEICVQGRTKNAKELNEQFLKQLNAGATSILLHCQGIDLSVVLKDIQLNYIHSTFFTDVKGLEVLKQYLEAHYKLAELNCTISPEKLNSELELEAWVNATAAFRSFEGIRVSCVDALQFHNQDCLAYYEIALALSQLTEQLEFYHAKKIAVPSSAFTVMTGVNADFFMQIAKLRAIRRLWMLLKKEYAVNNDLHLIAQTSLTNKSLSDKYNKLLRTTVEATAAVAGGCNELIVTDFDILFPGHSELGERLSVNQQLILKEESYFDKLADVACGSYYIETLTDDLAVKALETFKRFEKEGGYFNCLKKSLFAKEILQQAKEQDERVKAQKQIVIGVNKFRNEKEKLDLSPEEIKSLRNEEIHNPALNFELEHYFDLKNA
jgi:methylmalonyl-CoA mutase